MFVIRFAMLAIFAIMLLPTGPGDHNYKIISLDGGGGGFCDRYPKTCDASIELSSAFRQKLSYGIAMARKSLDSRSYMNRDDRSSSFNSTYRDDRRGEWQPGARRQSDDTYPGGTLAPAERSAEWRRDN